MISSIYIDVEELILELDVAAESPKAAQDWAARLRDTLIYGGRKKNPLPFGMYCITLSKGFAANGKLGRWKSIAKGILNKRDNNENPTEEEIVGEIIAQNGRDEYERVLAEIKAAKNAKIEKSLSADATAREDVENVSDGDNAATLESATSADTGTLDSLTDKDAGPVGAVAEKPSRATPAKYPHGEFQNVKLTDDEYASWCAKAGPEAEQLIEELSSYIASKGVKYKSHYATLCSWLSKRKKDESNRPKTFKELDDERVNERMRRIFG